MSSLRLILQSPEQIAYFLGANNYCWLHFHQGERKLFAKPLSYIETQLPDFVRVHKTVLVNPSHMKSLHPPSTKRMTGKVHMDTGEVFPISRRRWPVLAERFQKPARVAADHLELAALPIPPTTQLGVSQLPAPTTLSIVLVSTDNEKEQRVEQLIDQQYSAYEFKTVQQGSSLVDVLSHSTASDYPALILIDAQRATSERLQLQLLRGLKASPQLRQIPVVLFVSPSDPLIVEGYEHQANSVILLPNQYALFEELVGRILHYWLGVVALPRHDEE